MQKNYEETIESIRIYGGFYIGRYETGDLSKKKPVCVQYNEDIIIPNMWERYTFYEVYNKEKILGVGAGVKSMMIYGSLWDEVLMWLYESGAKSYSEIGGNSESWGNYMSSNFMIYESADAVLPVSNKPGNLIPTGARAGSNEDNWKRNYANNISDLVGNVEEYSQECSLEYLDYRGRGGDVTWDYAADSRARFSIHMKGDCFLGTRAYLIIL